MESSSKEESYISSTDVEEKWHHNLISMFKDASVFVLLLTGFSYLLAFVLRQGFLSFYGIYDLPFEDISIYSLSNSFMYVLLTLLGCYTIRLAIMAIFFPIRKEKLYRPIFIALYITVTCFFLLGYNFNVVVQDWVSWMVFAIASIVPILDWIFETKFKWYQRIIIPKKEALFYFFSEMKNKRFFRFVLLLIFLVVAILIMEATGNTQAEQREDYSLIVIKAKDKAENYVVIDKNGDNLLVAPVDIKKKVIIPKYRYIKIESTLKEPLILQPVKFKGGLKIKSLKEY